MDEISEQFDLGTILGVTTGINFTGDVNDIRVLIGFLCNAGDFMTMTAASHMSEVCKKHIFATYPGLADINLDQVEEMSPADAEKFLQEQKLIYGSKLSLSPMRSQSKEQDQGRTGGN